MISIADLERGVKERRVVFDKTGALLDIPLPDGLGPATLLVSEMTDALKTVEVDRVESSIDRAQVWMVDAIVLDEEVVAGLEGTISAEDLIDAVRDAGYEWQVSPTSAP